MFREVPQVNSVNSPRESARRDEEAFAHERGKVLQTRVARSSAPEVVCGEGGEQEARASVRGGYTPRQQLGRNSTACNAAYFVGETSGTNQLRRNPMIN